MKPNPTSYAELMAELGPDARIVCIRNHEGQILRGEEPKREGPTLSADFLLFAVSMGYARKEGR
jgi:hypothetical protein